MEDCYHRMIFLYSTLPDTTTLAADQVMMKLINLACSGSSSSVGVFVIGTVPVFYTWHEDQSSRSAFASINAVGSRNLEHQLQREDFAWTEWPSRREVWVAASHNWGKERRAGERCSGSRSGFGGGS